MDTLRTPSARRPRALCRAAGASLLALALLGSASAARGSFDPVELFFDKDLYQANETATLTVRGEPGHFVFLFIGTSPGSTPLPGIGVLEMSLDPFPAIVPLGYLPSSGELVVTCDFPCESPIIGYPCLLQAITVDPLTGLPSGLSNLEVLNAVGADCGVCPEAALVEAPCGQGTDHALTFPGIGTDFVFVAGGSFVERTDGTAQILGVVARASAPSQSFLVDIGLAGRVSVGDAAYPPPASPKLELCPEAYAENGGAIDTDIWHYYEELSGVLVGLDDFEGAALSVERMGPAFQVGLGANGKNTDYGASGWLDVEILSQPSAGAPLSSTGKGDVNIGLEGDCVSCPEEAEVDDEYAVASGGHALWLPQIGTDFVFEDGAQFLELGDGSALLSGVVVRESDAGARLQVAIELTDRIDPGSVDHPPAGSPKQELQPSAYVDLGGPVDPSLWRYYAGTDGVLTGLDDLSGAVLTVSRMGPAFQVGLGANGKNAHYGASGWLVVELVSQPDSGPLLPDDPPAGDINIDLTDCP